VVNVSATKPFLRWVAPIVPTLDRLVHRLSGGRRMLSEGGVVPVLMLTTVGARSGERRTTPLACVVDGDAIYIVGSNYGREHHPAWTANLLTTPAAEVSLRGERSRVHAELLDDDEKRAVWPTLVASWPNYAVYTARSGRNLRVFRLTRL
jgi:deazaflavin-dependent oxidoreductase (nitroreductase family)